MIKIQRSQRNPCRQETRPKSQYWLVVLFTKNHHTNSQESWVSLSKTRTSEDSAYKSLVNLKTRRPRWFTESGTFLEVLWTDETIIEPLLKWWNMLLAPKLVEIWTKWSTVQEEPWISDEVTGVKVIYYWAAVAACWVCSFPPLVDPQKHDGSTCWLMGWIMRGWSGCKTETWLFLKLCRGTSHAVFSVKSADDSVIVGLITADEVEGRWRVDELLTGVRPVFFS